MNKAELIDLVAEKTDLSKKDATNAVDTILDGIKNAVAQRTLQQIVSAERTAFTGAGAWSIVFDPAAVRHDTDQVIGVSRSARSPITNQSHWVRAGVTSSTQKPWLSKSR